MYCSNCGQKNDDTAAFCINCGAPISAVSGNPAPPQGIDTPSQGYQVHGAEGANPSAGVQTPKKKNTGLIIGLCAGGVVLVAAAVVAIILLMGGEPVEGIWLNEKFNEVLEFDDDGDVTVYTTETEIDGTYDYGKRSGEGRIETEDKKYDFIVNNDELVIENKRSYLRVDDDFDIDGFIEDAVPEPTETPEATPMPTIAPTPEATPMPTPEPTPVLETVTNQQMTLQFAFGERTGTYTGEVLDGLPHGTGSYTSANDYGVGWTYEGEWENGHFSGQGTSTYEDGYVITGYHQNDYLNGEGKEFYRGVLRYEGTYTDSIENGQGTRYNHHGEEIYSGTFAMGFISETAEHRSERLAAFTGQCATYTWQDLYDNAELELSLKAQVTGKVLQVYEYDEDAQYYCDFLMYEQGVEDIGRIVQVYYRLSEGEPKVQEGQTVTVWGTTEYLYSYTSVEDDYITCPQMEAWAVE